MMDDVRTRRVSPTHGALEQVVEIETPEQVVFSYTIAGVGSRAAAALVDHAIVLGALIALALVVIFVVGPVLDVDTGASWVARASGGWVYAVLILVQFVVQWGYYVLFEGLRDGQTPGKKWLGLRVVRDGGYATTFASSAARNIARILDMQPGVTYVVGLTALAVSRTGKRLGDHLAGTLVVRERLVTTPSSIVQQSVSPSSMVQSAAPPARSAEAVLTEDELELLRRFVSRVQDLEPVRRGVLAEGMVQRFRAHVDAGAEPVAALRALLAREQAARAAGAGGRGATGAAREHYALLREGADRWQAFATMLAAVQKRGLARLSEAEVAAFAAAYREVATDLARVSTASRGRDLDAVFRLSRLVAAGHNLLYRQERLPFAAVRRFLFADVPAELRRSWRPIVAAAVLFLGSGAVTIAAVLREPALVDQLVGPGMIDRAEVDAARARAGDTRYIDVDDYARPVLASAVIRNNIQVTFLCFASGLTAGIATALLLLLNGVMLGSAIALFATRGVALPILDFVVGHAVFELSAICIAAGGGFLIAGALLLPGVRTRREALVHEGRRALHLLAAAALFLVFAGVIEGLISPRTDIPTTYKVAVAVASALAIIRYITLNATHAPAPAPAPERKYSTRRRVSAL